MKLFHKKKSIFSSAIRGFEIFSIVIFSFLIVFSTLNLVTSKRGLSYMCDKYVRTVEINNEYFDNYIDSGFSEDDCKRLFSDERMYTLVSQIMTERMLALFRYTDNYSYTLDYCKESIKEIIVSYNNNCNLNLSSSKIDSLTDYTCDISGITSMFVYDTPLAYRNAIFDTEDAEDIAVDTTILKGLSILSSWYFLFMLIMMYIITVIILFFIAGKEEKKKIHEVIGNTSFYPSLLCTGIALGEFFGLPEEPIIIDYISLNLLKMGILGIIWSVLSFFLVHFIVYKISIK